MEVLHSRCAGLDVHKATVVACARLVSEGEVAREIETFGTTTGDLLKLSDWLAARGCTHVAMEATGIYWKPVWHVLGDGGFELILANAAHVRNVPGRKTDVADAAWLAELLAHGLIRASFVPDAATEAMRTLLRTRKQLVREKASHTQRLQKTLEDANIKLDSVISDLLGVSGRAMIEALIAGETDPAALAALARRLKAPDDQLRAALHGRVTRHHRFLMRLHLDQIDALDAAIAMIDQEVDAQLAPFRTAVRLLSSIPGVAALAAQVVVSEIGTDMGRFPTARASPVLGRPLSAQRRERREATLHPPAPRRPLAQDHPRAVRLGRHPQKGQLPPGPVPPPARPPRRQEGHLRRRRLHTHRRLAHAQAWHLLPGPPRRPLRQAQHALPDPEARQAPRRPRL
jgi:transposase